MLSFSLIISNMLSLSQCLLVMFMYNLGFYFFFELHFTLIQPVFNVTSHSYPPVIATQLNYHLFSSIILI